MYEVVASKERLCAEVNATRALSTETRVLTTDTASQRKFRLYWFVFSPGISLVRQAAFNLVKRDLEQFVVNVGGGCNGAASRLCVL
jgi:hypothetical protein